MSADNYVLIKQYKDDPKFRVSDQCASCDIDEDTYFASSHTLEEAVHIANKYQEEEFVEYGITIDLIK